ncbi:MmgE/PrpD family protein [Halorientalis litorea]|jgi:2-methylcitrate dehydratase|uniref:MmgE/PrpD family protein n=1 Tax=Halorientalis litorea TaxID=2931977 RepID=UPI001FF43B5A|nr:MmgE/PrpD family protein [Halorientalis litorea]
MATTETIAGFVQAVEFDEFGDQVVEELKKRVLDSVGIGVGALGEPPVEVVAETVSDVSSDGSCTLWGRELTASPSQAAMHNTALTRYLDYMDSFLAPGETPHPSDNIASVIACGEREDATGKDLIEAVGVSYELQGELAWNAPVRDKGWDHVTHTVLSAAAGSGAILGLDHEQLRNAVGIAGTAHNALRVTRTGGINEWKGMASANAARNGVYSCLLAENGMEGPVNLFEGQKGWKHIISDEFDVELDPGCEHVFDTMTKRYVAETYAQSAVEGIIELAEMHDLDHDQVESIHLDTFHGAKLIIGGGEGDRHEVETKAQADHSLPYMLAAALIDREMTNDAYDPERIQRDDVQSLLRKVTVEEDPDLTDRFESGEMPANLTITLTDGTSHEVLKDDFQGHPNNPMDWEQVEEKFEIMTRDRYDESRRNEIIETVRNLEHYEVSDLVDLLN